MIDDRDPSKYLLVIDWNPNAEDYIGLIELMDVYAYTWSYRQNEASWTPIMLSLRNVLSDGVENASETKLRLKTGLLEPSEDESEFVEFLYLKGGDHGWTWGMNGMTNAAFLEGAARDYFRRFF